VLREGPAALAEKLAVEARRFNCRLETDGKDFLRRNSRNGMEAFFRFVDDPSDIRSFRDIYARLAEVGSPVTYVIVHQRSETVKGTTMSSASPRQATWSATTG
jgi:hypothetical protein